MSRHDGQLVHWRPDECKRSELEHMQLHLVTQRFTASAPAPAGIHAPSVIVHQHTSRDTGQPTLLLERSNRHFEHLAHASHLQDTQRTVTGLAKAVNTS